MREIPLNGFLQGCVILAAEPARLYGGKTCLRDLPTPTEAGFAKAGATPLAARSEPA